MEQQRLEFESPLRKEPMKHMAAALLLIFCSSPALAIVALEAPNESVCEKALIKIRADDPASFGGMTAIGAERLVKAQRALIITSRNASQIFQGMSAIFESDFLAAVTRQNVMHLGDSGGAKSGHLRWLFSGKAWTKPIHELTLGYEIFGGQTQAGLERGVEEINREGSIVNSEFAILDELPNANPQLGSQLLAYLNPYERLYFEGGREMKGKTRTIFSTGNSTRAQLLKNYFDRGQFSGAALLNRFAFKNWVPNWGTIDELARLQETSARRNHLLMVERFGDAEQSALAREALRGIEAQDVDWDIVEGFAMTAFQPNLSLIACVRDLAIDMKKAMDAIRKESDVNNRNDPNNHPLIKEPSAEWSFRFFQEIMREIQASAALDYLRSHSEADVRSLKKPIELGPMSVWRAAYLSVPIGPGTWRFDPVEKVVLFNQTLRTDGKLVPLEKNVLKDQTRTLLSQDEMEFMFEEQEKFNEIIKNILSTMKIKAADVARAMEMEDDVDLELDSQDFEIGIARWRQKNP